MAETLTSMDYVAVQRSGDTTDPRARGYALLRLLAGVRHRLNSTRQ
jgi:hypothetical protein